MNTPFREIVLAFLINKMQGIEREGVCGRYLCSKIFTDDSNESEDSDKRIKLYLHAVDILNSSSHLRSRWDNTLTETDINEIIEELKNSLSS